MTKFYAYFIEDVKSAESVVEFSDNFVKFNNGVQYKVNYRSNQKTEESQTYDVYEVYRGDTLITDELSGVFFEYNNSEGYIKVRLYAENEDIIKADEQYFMVGRGY